MLDLSKLNPEQREAVTHTKGPLLILAGAGSGKTRVIVHRVTYLLERGVDPSSILAVSFTNRAVREMQERVLEMVSSKKQVGGLTLSTFHSLGVQILRREIARLDYPRKFAIYDAGDQLALVKRAMKDLRIADNDFDPKLMLEEISKAKNRLESPRQQADPLLRKVYDGYMRSMRSCGAVDFDDLIYLPVCLLRDDPEVLAHWSGRYKYIMIDEYQDTNRSQLNMVNSLASVHGNLCVVGDDDQSIYGWRGSDVENIRRFPDEYPGARTIMLTQNYRCSANILEAANKVIAESENRFPKKLWTESDGGQKIGLTVLENEEEEALSVINKLMQLKFEQQLKWSDIAIMYRTNAQSRLMEETLRTERVPYRLVGGQKFFERREVRDAVAYLRVLHRPEDELALRRIINYPARGIGNTTIERLHEYTKTHGTSFYGACLQYEQNSLLSTGQKKAVGAFVSLIEEFRPRLSDPTKFSEVFASLIEELRFTTHLYKEYENLSEAKRRVENIGSLLNGMVQYEERFKEKGSLEDYLERICLEPTDEKEEEDDDKVTLITLHGAKGLEFPVVFLVGMEEGFMPYYRMNGWDVDVEEERRLCYVGITRAKRWLYFSYALKRRRFGKLEERSPSRFLDNIPSDLFRVIGAHASVTESTEEEKEKKISSFFSGISSLLDG